MLEVDLSQAYTLEGALVVSCALAFSYQLGKLFFRGKNDAVNQYQPFEQAANGVSDYSQEDKTEVEQSLSEEKIKPSQEQQTSQGRVEGESQIVPEFNKAAANEELIEPVQKSNQEQKEDHHASVQEPQQQQQIEEKPIVLFVKPQAGETFSGYSLLKALADNDVHFSEQKHFQRFAESNGQGEVWFYVASLEQPGTFDMDEPGQVRCPGLVLILDCAKVKQLMHAYDALIESAHQLAEDLEAEVFDDTMQPLARAKINQWRHACARRAACVYS